MKSHYSICYFEMKYGGLKCFASTVETTSLTTSSSATDAANGRVHLETRYHLFLLFLALPQRIGRWHKENRKRDLFQPDRVSHQHGAAILPAREFIPMPRFLVQHHQCLRGLSIQHHWHHLHLLGHQHLPGIINIQHPNKFPRNHLPNINRTRKTIINVRVGKSLQAIFRGVQS